MLSDIWSLQIFIAYLHCVSLLHILIAYLCCISSLPCFIASIHRIYVLHIFMHIFISYLYCISYFIAYDCLHCTRVRAQGSWACAGTGAAHKLARKVTRTRYAQGRQTQGTHKERTRSTDPFAGHGARTRLTQGLCRPICAQGCTRCPREGVWEQEKMQTATWL